MSLIERAVQKLGPSARPASEPPVGPAPSQPASTIEAAMGRAAVQAPAPATPLPAAAARPADGTTARPGPAPSLAPSVALALPLLRERGFVTPDGAATRIAQEFRIIKRPLLANAFGKGVDAVPDGRRVMVTSAFPGEGKSYCAINLAMSIAAERDHQVLLVDADVARPSLPHHLGVDLGDAPGLMDWLVSDTLDLDMLVRPTSVDKLWLLPAGRRHEHATELLASDAMTRLLGQLSSRYPERIVIFDSPPLLMTTESRVLASYMGQVVMVVEAGRTERDAVTDALATLPPDRVVGLVLNKASAGGGGSYGYGYAGYGDAAN